MKNKPNLHYAQRVATVADRKDLNSPLQIKIYRGLTKPGGRPSYYGRVESKPGTTTHRSEPLTLHATNLNDAKDEAETLLGIIRGTLPEENDISPALAVHVAVTPELKTPSWVLDLQTEALDNSTRQTPQEPILDRVLRLAGLGDPRPTNSESGTAPNPLDHILEE
jgi:hypothetical protein